MNQSSSEYFTLGWCYYMTFLGNRKRAFDSRHTTTLNYTPTPTPTQTKRAGVEPPAPLTFYATIPVSPRLLAYGGRNRLRLGQPVVVYGRGPRLLGPDLPVNFLGGPQGKDVRTSG